jgi:arachidonate 15-lipoxygenase
VRHLAHTHLVVAPFRIAAKKTLAPRHPVARLLDPHQEGTLYINDAANNALMAPRGGVDAVMALSIEDSRAVCVDSVKRWDFKQAMIAQELADRDLLDREALPDFPYRDDGLLIWNAIHDWVEAYVRTYYRRDADVAADAELQAFFREVQSPDGGRINNVGAALNIHYLVDSLTQIIFTGSAQHAAVNFPQLPVMSYMPSYPLCAFGNPPGREPVSESDYLAMLPALDLAQYQSTLGYMLGRVGFSLPRALDDLAKHHRVGDRLLRLERAFEDLRGRLHHRGKTVDRYPVVGPQFGPFGALAKDVDRLENATA